MSKNTQNSTRLTVNLIFLVAMLALVVVHIKNLFIWIAFIGLWFYVDAKVARSKKGVNQRYH